MYVTGFKSLFKFFNGNGKYYCRKKQTHRHKHTENVRIFRRWMQEAGTLFNVYNEFYMKNCTLNWSQCNTQHSGVLFAGFQTLHNIGGMYILVRDNNIHVQCYYLNIIHYYSIL